MNFRAIVQDGIIVVNTHGALPDGTPVEVSVVKGPRKAKTSTAGKKARKSRARHTPGFGIWTDRDELGTPDQAVDRLRALTRRRKIG